MRRLRRSPLALIPPKHHPPQTAPVPELFASGLQRRHCYFCPAAPRDEYVVSAETVTSLPAGQLGESRQRLLLPLCATHHRVLRRAEKLGRVHGPTGIRYWMGGH